MPQTYVKKVTNPITKMNANPADKIMITYVCNRNRTRSYAAEFQARKIVEGMGISGSISVSSAGLYVPEYQEHCSPIMNIALKRMGYLDFAYFHKPVQLDRDRLLQSRLVLSMTEREMPHILKIAPEVAEQTFNGYPKVNCLAEHAGFPKMRIYDPQDLVWGVPFWSKLIPFRKTALRMSSSYLLTHERVFADDFEGVIEIHHSIAEDIGFLVRKSLERIVREMQKGTSERRA